MNYQPVRLETACDIIMGQAPSGEAYNDIGEGWPLVAGASDFGETHPSAKKFTTEAAKLSRPGDIILGVRATIGEKVWSDDEYCLGRGVAGLRPMPHLDSSYLWHWLDHIRPEIERKSKGATFKQVTRTDIAELPLALPPLEEQRRIAAILNKADSIHQKRCKLFKLSDKFLLSVFFDMFGDPINNERGWVKSSLGSIAPGRGEIVDGPFGSSLKPDQYVEDGVRVVRNFNVRPGYFDSSAYKYVTPEKFAEIRRSEAREGDLLLSTKGTVGNVCLMPRLEGPSVLSATGTVRIRISSPDVDSVFLMHQMLTPQYQQHIEKSQSGAVQQYLNLSGIRDLPIILPPLELQRKFSAIAARQKSLVAKFKFALQEGDTLFSSLANRAFSGQL